MSEEREVIRLSRAEFDALPEYSGTLPTGTTIGKRWKRNDTAYNYMRGLPPAPPRWFMGEYVTHPEPGQVGIVWRDIEIVDETPTPARSEAAGGEEVTRESVRHAVLNDPKMHAAYTVGRIEEHDRMQREMDDLRQQIAAAREDGERLDVLSLPTGGAGIRIGVNRPGLLPGASLYVGDDPDPYDAATLRGAIDAFIKHRAARSEPSGEGETCGTMPPVRVTPIRRGKPMPYDVPDDEPRIP